MRDRGVILADIVECARLLDTARVLQLVEDAKVIAREAQGMHLGGAL